MGENYESIDYRGRRIRRPYLVNHLHDDLGYEVAVTKTAKEQLALSNAVVYDCDILNKSEITDVLETVRPDYIFHLAAQSSVSVSWKNRR